MKCDKCNDKAYINLISIARPDELWVCVKHYHEVVNDPDLDGMWILHKIVK